MYGVTALILLNTAINVYQCYLIFVTLQDTFTVRILTGLIFRLLNKLFV